MARHDYPGAPTPEERIHICIHKIATGIAMAITCFAIMVSLGCMLICM